jgi:glutathione S-transferase
MTQNKPMTLPILYSLRNCPFAMRARLAIFRSKKAVELRDVVLSNKPAKMLVASPKGTVPILVLGACENKPLQVIDESLDIMLWVLGESDPHNLLRAKPLDSQASSNDTKPATTLAEMLSLIDLFDNEFKRCLEAYKSAKRYHDISLQDCRQQCEVYIQNLEQRLSKHPYLMDEHESLVDIALLPFIRQFARIERQWYLQSPYPQLKQWLNRYLQSAMFTKVMAKYPLWTLGQPVIKFGDI